MEEYLAKANKLFTTDIAVSWYELPREEALKIPGIVKMAEAFPPDLPILRIVEILRFGQASGWRSLHVRNLKEIGKVELLKTENKGKNNKTHLLQTKLKDRPDIKQNSRLKKKE